MGAGLAQEGKGSWVFRAAGTWVEKIAGTAKIDIVDLGKIKDFLRAVRR